MPRRLGDVLAAPLLAVLLAAPAHADPGTATLTVSPNPTTAYYGGTETFTGCGYDVGDWIDVYVAGAVVGSGPVDSAGCIQIVSAGWVGAAGEYVATAAHQVQTGQTVKVRDLAQATLVAA